MRRYALRAGLGLGFLMLGGAATLVAAPPSVIDLNVAPADTRNPAPTSTPGRPAEPARPGNPLWAIPLKDLSATLERPIFSPSRRPPPPVLATPPYVPPPPPPPAPPPSPQLTLIGTVVNTHEGFGIFFDQATSTIVRLRTGEAYNGWTLRSVQGREATLQRDSETTVLALPARDDQTGVLRPVAPSIPIGEPMRNPPPRLHHGPDD
jgi:hypothetical protein